jgi:hypothetical protein
MKLRRLLLSLVVSTASASASIDFTPTTGERVLNGIKFPQLIFNQDGRKITYEQPRGWKYTAASAGIKFIPPGVADAQAEIEQSPLPKPQAFDEVTVNALQERVLRSIPPSSQKATLISSQKNPFMVNRHEVLAVIVSYELSGVEFMRSVVFVNLPDTELRFRLTARKQQFEQLNKQFRGSIFSWQGA